MHTVWLEVRISRIPARAEARTSPSHCGDYGPARPPQAHVGACCFVWTTRPRGFLTCQFLCLCLLLSAPVAALAPAYAQFAGRNPLFLVFLVHTVLHHFHCLCRRLYPNPRPCVSACICAPLGCFSILTRFGAWCSHARASYYARCAARWRGIVRIVVFPVAIRIPRFTVGFEVGGVFCIPRLLVRGT